jgi:hypothetical protein
MQFQEITPPAITPLDIENATEKILHKLDQMRAATYKAKHPKTVMALNGTLFRIRKLY